MSVSGTEQDTSIVRYLLLSGADPAMPDALGRSPHDLAIECEFAEAVDLFEATPPTEEECDAFYATSRTANLVQPHREQDFSGCPKDADGNPIITRQDMIPMAPELKMHEHHIFPTATTNYKASRKDGAQAIRNLDMLLEQSGINEARRDNLANSVEVNMRKEGKMNWRRG